MVDMVIEGTIGTALATLELLKGLAQDIDTGAGWMAPVRVFGVKREDAVALKELFAEHNFSARIVERGQRP